MPSEYVNGYYVTGNHGNTVEHPGRLYHVEDGTGVVVKVEGDKATKSEAIARAKSLPPGNASPPVAVEEPVVETVEEETAEEPVVEEKRKSTKKKTAKKSS